MSHRLAAVLIALSFAGCGKLQIVQPSNGTTVTSPVTVVAEWSNIQGSPELLVDSVDFTNQFMIDFANKKATATLTLSPSQHSVSIFAKSYCSYCNPDKYPRSGNTVTFIVPTPTVSVTLSLTPAAVVVERGTSATVTMDVTRTNFTGALTASAAALPAGVTATGTVAANQNSGTLTVTASNGAAYGTKPVSVKVAGSTGTPTSTKTLAVTVGRKSGSFAEVTIPTSQVAGGPATSSPGGAFKVRVVTGSSAAIPQQFAAIFETSATPAIHKGTVGFQRGPTSNLGGAAFCAGDSAGVVLSGQLPGYASDHVFQVQYFPRNVMIAQEAWASKIQPPAFVQPRVFFSPDCSIAMFAAADRFGTGTYALNVVDMHTGANLGTTLSTTATSFSAQVNVVAGKSNVRVTAGSQVVNYVVP